MTNKIFAMNETAITAMDNFFDRMVISMNIRAKKLIVNKSYLNIEQHFHRMIDETRELKINVCDDYDVFEAKMKHKLRLVHPVLFTKLLEWLNEKLIIYFKNQGINDEHDKLRITGKVSRIVIIKICYDTELLKRMAGM